MVTAAVSWGRPHLRFNKYPRVSLVRWSSDQTLTAVGPLALRDLQVGLQAESALGLAGRESHPS